MSFLSSWQLLKPRHRQRLPGPEIRPNWWVSLGNYITPSDEITWQEETIAIYQTQPIISLKQRFVIVGDSSLINGDIEELLDHLDSRDNIPQVLSELQGMFALVIWDRNQRQLWLGRDPVGARNLYYTINQGILRVAPRLSTLGKFHPQQLDYLALRDYLSCAFIPGEQTIWEGVKEVRPGTIHQWSDAGKSPEIQVYWQPEEQIGDRDQPLEYYSQKLRSLLNEVVEESLPIGEPVGTYLSGGLDSSAITALASQFHQHQVHTYSIHFGAEYPNELEFANLVAEHCQTQHHILEIKPESVWDNLAITMANLDDPIGDPLTVPNYLLGQVAKQDVGVILNGEGGDPCFGGPKNKPMLLYELYGNIYNHFPNRLTTYLESFKKCYPHLPELLKPEIWQQVKDAPSVFEPDLNAANEYLNRLMLINIKFKGADHILTKVSNMTSAAGLAGRSPLFDQRVVDLSLQVPPAYKLFAANEKAVLKAAVTDILPASIIYRPKSGMRVPVGSWFYHHWKQRTQALLLNKNAAIAPYINQKFIKEFFNPQSPAYQKFGIKLWLLVSLEIWLQTHQS